MKTWKAVVGFENYLVSNDGEIKNKKTERILKQHISTSGYYQIMMGRKTIPQYVHRLVALSFIENEKNKPQVDHIDGNKLNNSVENLRWVTVSENRFAYGYEQSNLNRQKPIIAIHKNGEILEFISRTETAKYFKCHKSTISYDKEYRKGAKKGWTFKLKI